MNFYIYLLEASSLLGILTLGFVVFLRNAPFFHLNRFLILALILGSLIIPVLPKISLSQSSVVDVGEIVNYVDEKFEIPNIQYDEPINITPLKSTEMVASPNVKEEIDLLGLIKKFYWLGLVLMSITFCIQIFSSFILMKQYSPSNWNGKLVYTTTNNLAIFSFFNRIFLNGKWQNLSEEEKYMVFLHEQEHVKQKHSLDLILLEIVKIVFWFHPAIWILKRHLRMQHEYQVDAVVQQNHEPSRYAELLLQLACQPQKKLIGINPMSSFNHLKKRFNMMSQNKTLNSKWRYAIFSFLFVASCTFDEELIEVQSSEELEFIESIYISHQSDTQIKDNRRVAIAYFNPDGSLAKAVQHMTYPYTKMDEKEILFWGEPNIDNLPFIMDGFKLGFAEKNLLYGNDWSKAYSDFIERNGHPKYLKYPTKAPKHTTNIEYNNNLPTTIDINENINDGIKLILNGNKVSLPHVIENFEYSENKVTNYRRRYSKSLEYLENKTNGQTEGLKKQARSLAVDNGWFFNALFSYKDNQLTEVVEGRHTYKFYYDEEGKITKSEFYIQQDLMHHREYFYKEDGRREKTVIYNAMNEPEYTIKYNYGYSKA